jgi:hypothetical protein
MVQVDVFWSYGIGASFAVSSSRQLLARRRAARELEADPQRRRALPEVGTSVLSRWSDPYLLRTILFLALVFVPSGVWLVWGFPSWETMHVGDRDMPAWLVTLFALTNVTQGVLGYLVVDWLLGRGRTYLAYLQVVAGYLGMFAILVHGWDGKGYQRFFSPTHADFLNWHGDWTAWLSSDVALALYGMGVVLVPVLLLTTAHWHVTGYALDAGAQPRPGRARVMALMLVTVFGAALGLAVAIHLAIAWLGTPFGAAAAVALVVLALLPRGPVHALFRAFGFPEAAAQAGRRVRAAAPTTAARASA